jgi:hypothetical protein
MFGASLTQRTQVYQGITVRKSALVPLHSLICSGFCMVANSLLAYASVNHLHYHFLYIDYPRLPARTLGGREVNGTRGCYQLTRYCVRGFGFQLDSDPQSCARAIFQVVSLLLESGVPYNIAMLRGPAFSDPHASDPRHPPNAPPSLVRTILIPRKPVLGMSISGGGGKFGHLSPREKERGRKAKCTHIHI